MATFRVTFCALLGCDGGMSAVASFARVEKNVNTFLSPRYTEPHACFASSSEVQILILITKKTAQTDRSFHGWDGGIEHINLCAGLRSGTGLMIEPVEQVRHWFSFLYSSMKKAGQEDLLFSWLGMSVWNIYR
jgi:hypothetical protein